MAEFNYVQYNCQLLYIIQIYNIINLNGLAMICHIRIFVTYLLFENDILIEENISI